MDRKYYVCGFLVYLYIIYLTIFNFIKEIKIHNDLILIYLFSGAMIIIIHSCMDTDLSYLINFSLFFILLGLLNKDMKELKLKFKILEYLSVLIFLLANIYCARTYYAKNLYRYYNKYEANEIEKNKIEKVINLDKYNIEYKNQELNLLITLNRKLKNDNPSEYYENEEKIINLGKYILKYGKNDDVLSNAEIIITSSIDLLSKNKENIRNIELAVNKIEQSNQEDDSIDYILERVKNLNNIAVYLRNANLIEFSNRIYDIQIREYQNNLSNIKKAKLKPMMIKNYKQKCIDKLNMYKNIAINRE